MKTKTRKKEEKKKKEIFKNQSGEGERVLRKEEK